MAYTKVDRYTGLYTCNREHVSGAQVNAILLDIAERKTLSVEHKTDL